MAEGSSLSVAAAAHPIPSRLFGFLCLTPVVACATSPRPAAAESVQVERSAPGASQAPSRSRSASIVCDRVLDDFSRSEVGAFPRGWRVQGEDEPARVAHKSLYVVEELDGRHVLHARFLRETVTIALVVDDWDLQEDPVLQWRWRALSLPDGGRETDSSHNDTGAAVYALWKTGFPFYLRGIKYAWSSTLPVGTRDSKRFGHDQLLVVESGRERLGTWQTVRVDVRAHYRAFFDQTDVPPPTGIAVMTDADATASQAEAYYADFRLCSAR